MNQDGASASVIDDNCVTRSLSRFRQLFTLAVIHRSHSVGDHLNVDWLIDRTKSVSCKSFEVVKSARVTLSRGPSQRYSALMSDNQTDEARRHARVMVRLPAVLVAGGERTDIGIVLIDLAQGGVLIKTQRSRDSDEVLPPPPIGARATLTFRMIGNRLCEAKGQVVRHRADEFALGFEEINRAMEAFTRNLANLPQRLRGHYMADILHPRLSLDD